MNGTMLYTVKKKYSRLDDFFYILQNVSKIKNIIRISVVNKKVKVSYIYRPEWASNHEYKSFKTYSGMGPLSVVHRLEG